MGRARQRREDLTNRIIANLAHDPKGPRTQVVWDEKVKPLGIRLNSSGRHTWVLNGRKTLGHWPDLRSEDARREALSIPDEPKVKGGFTWRDGLLHYMENRRTAKKQKLIKDSPSSKVRVEQLENRMPFADVPMTATTPTDVSDFLREYEDRPSMSNALRSTLRSVWAHCVEHELVSTRCPVITRPLPTDPRRDFFTLEELDELYELLATHKNAPWILAFAKLTYIWALRGREALTLRWDWIRGGVMEVPERKAQGRTEFPMWPEVKDVLAKLPRVRGCPLVFEPPRGYKPNRTFKTLAVAFSAAAQEHWPGRKLTPHSLRRSRATHMRDAGCTAGEIMALTGHKTEAQLQTYIGRAPKRVMDSLSPSAVRARAKRRG